MAKLVFIMGMVYFAVIAALHRVEVIRVAHTPPSVIPAGGAGLKPRSSERPQGDSAPVYVFENNTWYCVKNCPAFTGK
ncbi:MAG TPA: hypothetical protein VFI62_06995 [Burkholderiales bacterium]|nr:hypothetical protein [Burkholderiales bacterium]